MIRFTESWVSPFSPRGSLGWRTFIKKVFLPRD